MKKLIIVLWGIFICNLSYSADISSRAGWLHTPNSNYDNSWTTDLRLENRLYQNFNIGLEGGYHGKQFHQPEYGDLSGYHLLGEILYYQKVSWKLKPYIFGGVGWSWWNFDRSQIMVDKGIAISVGNSFAKKVGLGAYYEINSRWSINLEWHYFQSHVPKDSHYESDGSFANVVTDEKTIGQEETNLMVGLKYRF